MGRGLSFSPAEIELLRENFDRTIAELEELLAKHGYVRSRKSINRKLEKMREDGAVGFRSRDTIKRSYRQRTRRNKRLEPTKLEENQASFDEGGGSFDDGDASFDSGEDWDAFD